jgi:methyl-accepting chemotaxis protein
VKPAHTCAATTWCICAVTRRTISSASLTSFASALGALAGGDLSQRITREYSGVFEQVKNDANATSEKLSAIIEDVGRVFSGMAEGDLTQRITRDAEGERSTGVLDCNWSCTMNR